MPFLSFKTTREKYSIDLEEKKQDIPYMSLVDIKIKEDAKKSIE